MSISTGYHPLPSRKAIETPPAARAATPPHTTTHSPAERLLRRAAHGEEDVLGEATTTHSPAERLLRRTPNADVVHVYLPTTHSPAERLLRPRKSPPSRSTSSCYHPLPSRKAIETWDNPPSWLPPHYHPLPSRKAIETSKADAEAAKTELPPTPQPKGY